MYFLRFCLISHASNNDGRLNNLLNVFSHLGELCCITQGSHPFNENNIVHDCNYFTFIFKALKYAMSLDNVDAFVLDNRKAALIGLILMKLRKLLNRRSIYIYDCRELYLMHDVKHFVGKVGCFFEKYMIKKADILICANQERAKFMCDIYSLQEIPLVYENVRQLAYESYDAFLKAQERFKFFIHDDEIRIVSSCGCDISRGNDALVKSLTKINRKCRLFLCGKSSAQDERYLRKLIRQLGLDNVEITGMLSHSELKFLIQHSHIGIVSYKQNDFNNRFCASGKLYEFIYEGIPIVTTTNPPLKRLCDQHHIGVTDDTYSAGINTVLNNYDYFVERVRAFAAHHTIKQNDDALSAELKARLSISGNL